LLGARWIAIDFGPVPVNICIHHNQLCMHTNVHFLKCRWGPGPSLQCMLCTLLKMETIMHRWPLTENKGTARVIWYSVLWWRTHTQKTFWV
jgi:hypothetical protein